MARKLHLKAAISFATAPVLAGLVASAGLPASAFANARYTTWQSLHPFTQTAWTTHEGNPYADPYNVPLILSGGLNTGWDGRNSGSAANVHPMSLGLPTL